MGKVPSRIKFDEDGLPIPQTMQADSVQFDEDGLPIPVKKKAVGTNLSMVGGKAVPGGGQVGSSKAQSSGLISTGEETEADIQRKQYLNKLEGISYDEKDPLKSVLTPIKAKISENKKRAVSENTQTKYAKLGASINNQELIDAENKVNKFRFPSVDVAKNVAIERLDKTKLIPRVNIDVTNVNDLDSYTSASIANAVEKDNLTGQKAVQQYINNRNISDQLLSSSSFGEAAIKNAIQKGGNTAENIQQLEGDIPQTMKGDILMQYLQDPDVMEVVAKNPQLRERYRNEMFRIPKEYPLTAVKILASYISKAREDKGLNNGILNVTLPSDNDKIVDELVESGVLPSNYKDVYYGDSRIRDLVNANLKTSGFTENTLRSADESVNAIGKSVADLSQVRKLYSTEADRAYTQLAKQHSDFYFKPKGILHEISTGGGIVTGQVLPMMLGGTALNATKIVNSTKAANAIMAGLQSWGENKDRALTDLPGAGWKKQLAYATINTGLDVALSGVFDDVKLAKQLVSKVAPEVKSVITKFTSKEITESAAKQEVKNIFFSAVEKAPNFLKGSFESATREAVEESATQALQIANNQVFGGEPVTFGDAATQVFDVFRTTFLGSLPLGIGGGIVEARKNPETGSLIYDMASAPEKFEDIIRGNAALDPEYAKDIDQKLANLRYISAVKADLDGMEGISKKQKEKFLLDSLSQKILSEEAASKTDPTIKKDILKKVDELEKEKVKTLEEKVELTDSQKAIKKSLDNGTLKGMNETMAKMALEDSKSADAFIESIADQAKNETATSEGSDTEMKAEIDFGASLVNFALERFPELSKAIELDPNLPEGYQLPEQQKQETEVNIPELPKPSIEQTEAIKQIATGSEEFDGIPPTTEPPTNEGEDKFEGKGGREDKGILNRLFNAKNTPEAAKKGFLDEGLKYQTKSQTEAAALAKSVVDEFGIDESVKMATSMKFDGDVNSLIFAEALNRLSEQESSAKTQDEKLETAKRFAEIGIEYDKMARYGGRFNAAINHFYKKSPLGIVLMENAKRQEDFKDWSKSKEKSWKQGFDELMKDPEFEKVFEEKVGERVKQERKEARKAKKEKVHKAIDETMAKWAKKFSADLPEGTKKAGVSIDIFKAAATTMKAAYDAGEAIGKVIQDAIDYITKETGVTDWDKEGFKKEWAERLTEKGGKVFTDEELKSKVLDKFRKKLNGLTDKQKEEVVRKSFKKIIDNGGLEYDEFKKIIQDVVGRGELTEDEQAKLKELVGKTNAVEEAAKKYREERTEEAEKEFRKAEIEAGKATRELNEILWNRPDVVKRLTSIMQLNTLGIPALVNNPIYNMWNQSTLRFPVGVVNDAIDRAISLAAKVFGKKYERDYNVWGTQKEFFKKLGFGSRESVQQLLTGLNRMDYIQKEVYGQQIRPGRAMRDLYAFATGKKNLTKAQIIDKALQSTVGIPAEAVARMLNIGDKPQRFAAEGAQAATFAKNLGLKDMDYKLFIEFPREEAYRIYKEQGLSDEEAGKKADYIKDVIVKEGERSTFQQDNLLNKVISAAFGVLGGKDSGYAALAKSLTVSPFIKIPSNAFWSYYNLVNPEVAILQSMVHAGRAKALSGKGDNSSKLAMREARYWFAHAITGMAMRSVVIAMVQAGVFRPANDEDDTKKEREGEGYYEPQGTVNLAKLSAWLRGDDPTKVKGGVLVQNRWFGQWGTVGNSIAKKWQDATPEQREKQDEFWNTVLGGMEVDALKEMGNGVFANTSALLSAIDTNGSFGWSQYGLNTIGLFTNILHPATFAQISRAQLNEATTNRADTFMGQVKNAMLTRSSVLRKLTGQYPETKVGIWGDKIEKQGNVVQRLFGVTPSNKDAFARPIYDDAVRTNDIGYFPPAVQPKIGDTKLTQEQYNKLQEYVGKARRSYVAPFINDQANIVGFNVLYSQLNDEDKKYVLQYLYGLGSEEGKLKLYDDYPELKPKEEDVNYTQEIQRDLFKILQKYQK